MRRVTQDELEFYDALAQRLNRVLGDPACCLTQSSLANRIGWHRASLCNFLNRIDKTIPAHFIPRISHTLRLSIDELMGGAARIAPERASWDPRADDAEALIEKLRDWRDRNLPNARLHGHLPPMLLPRRGMVANYVHSVFDGEFADAAERWHDLIDAEAQLIAEHGEGDVVHIISRTDLLRLPDREYPFQHFSTDEVVYALEMLKKNWVRHRGFALIVLEDGALTPEAKLELASSTSIVAVGREVRVEYGNDFRVRWNEDAEAAGSTDDLFLGLKTSAGLGARERPTTRQVEELIDELLRRAEGGRRIVRLLRNANTRRIESSRREPANERQTYPRRINFAALAALSLSLHFLPGYARAESRNLPAGSDTSLIEAADTLVLAGLQKQFEGIAHRVSPAVVAISAAADGSGDDESMRNENLTPQKLDSMLSRTTRTVGTGLFIDQNGFIVTNEHVVAESAELWVTTDDRKVFPAIVIGSDPRSDLAVLKIPADNTPTVKFAMNKSVQRGDWAIALGNPYGLACEGGVAMSVGVVSAVDRSLPRLSSKENRLYSGLIQTTAQINPGSSGGPLFDLNGEVIGINTAVILPHQSANGISFAIPVTPELMRELDVLKQGGEVVYGYVGLTVGQPTPRELKAAGVSGGARVDSIEDKSPAAGTGIHNNDLVVAINGSAVRNADHFIRLVGKIPVDQRGSISVSRGGKTVEIAVTPRKRQAQAAAVNKWTQRLRWHGMTLGPVPSNWSARHGDQAVAGIYVVGVDNPELCSELGVKQGSIIRAVAGKIVRSIADLQTVIDATPPDAIRVEVMDETAVAAIEPAQ